MTKDEVRLAGKTHSPVIYDMEPEKKYRVRSLQLVFSSDDEIKHHWPAERVEVELEDLGGGSRKICGPSQIEPVNPVLMQVLANTIEK